MTSSGSKRRARSAAEALNPRQKLTGIVNGRVRRALQALEVLGNVSKLGASKNQLSEADVALIMATVQHEVARTGKRLMSGATGAQSDLEFDLDAKEH